MEFEESGELTKNYMQRSDHIETKDVQNARELQKLTADKPFTFEGSASGEVAQHPALGIEKPKAELEVQARSLQTVALSFSVRSSFFVSVHGGYNAGAAQVDGEPSGQKRQAP